jgi:hypothetical protein
MKKARRRASLHDEKGRVVAKMDDETQGNIGLLVAKPRQPNLFRKSKVTAVSYDHFVAFQVTADHLTDT